MSSLSTAPHQPTKPMPNHSLPLPEQKLTFSDHPTKKGVFRLVSEFWSPSPISEVFKYFADASNLERITPPWLNFRIVNYPKGGIIKGSLIDYRLRIRGIPIKWRTEITDWNPPHSFEDTQLKGPYRQWIHTHTFSELNGGTVCHDQIDYAMIGGRLVNWLLVQRDLRRIFAYRQRSMLEMFGSAPKVSQADKA